MDILKVFVSFSFYVHPVDKNMGQYIRTEGISFFRVPVRYERLGALPTSGKFRSPAAKRRSKRTIVASKNFIRLVIIQMIDYFKTLFTGQFLIEFSLEEMVFQSFHLFPVNIVINEGQDFVKKF